METKELRAYIAESQNAEWFNTIEITYRSDKLKGFSNIHKFLKDQADGWENLNLDLPKELADIKSFFREKQGGIEQFTTDNVNQEKGQVDNNWRINRINISNNLLTFDSWEAAFLINLHKKHPELFKEAYNFIISNERSTINLNGKNNLSGAVLSIINQYKDVINIDKDKYSSLSGKVNNLEKYLAEVENQTVDYLSNTKKLQEEHAAFVENFKNEKNNEFNNWLEKSNNDFFTLEEASKKRITDIEKTYEELLRLKKPAEYWKIRAQELKKEGSKARCYLVFTIGITAFVVILLMICLSNNELMNLEANKLLAIKLSVGYITFISLAAYLIRIFNKSAFSAYHLSRDAEEREQLTYVYLALIKETDIDIEEKKLIMQSLFSRADTGLLKEDSSPTMPSDFTTKFFGGK